MRHKIGLVLDCHDPEALAEFWSEALGYTTLGGAGNYVMLVDGDGQGPKLLLQRVPEPKPGKNRMHFDVETPEVERPDDAAQHGKRPGQTALASSTSANPSRQLPRRNGTEVARKFFSG
jgi:hypothetical protein